MSGYVGIVVSDPSLQNQFTQVELRSLKTHVSSSILFFHCFYLFFEMFKNKKIWNFAVHEHEERQWKANGRRFSIEDVEIESCRRKSQRRRESFVDSRLSLWPTRWGWFRALLEGMIDIHMPSSDFSVYSIIRSPTFYLDDVSFHHTFGGWFMFFPLICYSYNQNFGFRFLLLWMKVSSCRLLFRVDEGKSSFCTSSNPLQLTQTTNQIVYIKNFREF